MKENNRVLSLLLCIVMVIGMLSAFCLPAMADVGQIAFGEEKFVQVSEGYKDEVYSFTPSESGYYRFYSYDREGDPFIHVYSDAELSNEIEYDDDGGEGWEFSLNLYVKKDTTVYAACSAYDMASYKFKIEKSVFAESVEIIGADTLTGYVGFSHYFEYQMFPEYSLEESLEFTSSDTDVVEFSGNEAYFKSVGTATVTLTTENGLTDSIEVTVKEPETIEVGTSVVLNENEYAIYKFVPTEGGYYSFTSTYGSSINVYDSNFEYYYGENGSYNLSAGETYYFRFYSYDFKNSFTLKKMQKATAVEIDGADTLTDYVGFSRYFSYQYFPENAVYEGAEFTSSDTDVAEFFGNELRFKSAGTVTATLTTQSGLTDSVEITVKEPETIEVGTSVVLNENEYAICKFVPTESGYYSYTMMYGGYIDVYDGEYEYFDSEGGSYNLNAGETYYFKVYSYNYGNSFTLIQRNKATSVKITDADDFTGYVGFSHYFEYQIFPEDAIYENAEFTSSDTDVVEFSENEAHFKSVGSATVTVTTQSGLTDSVEVTVKEPETFVYGMSVVLNNNEYSIYKFVPTENGYYSYSSTGSGSWDVFDSNFEYYYGEIKAGETYYLRFYSYEEGNIFTLIRQQKATSVQIPYGDNFVGYVGTTEYFDHLLFPDNAMYEDVVWTSSDTDVVYFTANEAHFKSAGTATVTVTTENGLTDSIEVTVKEPEVILAGQPKTLTFDDENTINLKFIPDTTGIYNFYSESDGIDPQLSVYRSVQPESPDEQPYIQWVGGDDDGGSNGEFKSNIKLEAGETYYLEIYVRGYGNVTVYCEEVPAATDLSVSLPEKAYEHTRYNTNVTPVPENAAVSNLWVRADNQEVINCVQSSGSNLVEFFFEKKGNTTVRVSAAGENGVIEKSYDVEVCEPELVDISKKTVLPAVYNEEIYGNVIKFTVPKDGYYRFNFSTEWSEVQIYDSQNDEAAYWYIEGKTKRDVYLEKDETYVLTYSDENDLTVQCSETVAPQQIKLEKNNVTIYEQGYVSLQYMLLPEGCADIPVIYKPTDYSVLDVYGCSYDNGEKYIDIDGIAPGKAKIELSLENGSLKTEVDVTVIPAEVITENNLKTFDFTGTDGEKSILKFVPAESGYYTFKFEGGEDLYGDINSADGDFWCGVEGGKYTGYLTGGKTYYADVGGSGEYSVIVKKSVEATGIQFDRGENVYVGEKDWFEMEVSSDPFNSYVEYIYTTLDNELCLYATSDCLVAHTPGTSTLTASTGGENPLTTQTAITVTPAEEIKAGERKTKSFDANTISYTYKFTADEEGYYLVNQSAGCEMSMDPESYFNSSPFKSVYMYEGESIYIVVKNRKVKSWTSDIYVDKCENVKSVSTSSKDCDIWWNALDMCTSLTEIKIEGHMWYTAKDGVAYSNDMKYVEYCARGVSGKVTLAKTAEEIYWEAFNCCDKVTEIVMPDTVNYIGSHAFYGSGITKVKIPASVTSISYGAFRNCTDLKEVSIPKSLERIDTGVFNECDSLETVLYEGTKEEFDLIEIYNGNDALINAKFEYNSREHSWGEWVYNKNEDTETRTCDICGGSETREMSENPTYRPDHQMPFVKLNEAGNGVVLDQNKSWATRVYWGNIGEEQVEYKWFDDDFRLLCGTDYFADFTPRQDEVYNFTKPGWYRFVVKAIRTGTTAEDYTYSELLFDFYYDGTNAPTVPTVEELGDNQVKINSNGTAIKKFYYGNIGQKNTPYSWFNDFWGTALATKTYTSVFDTRDGRIITLQTKGYYNIVIVTSDNTEYVYTVYADENAPVIKKTENGVTVDIDCLKGNVGTKATLNRIYYGYIGTEDKEISNYDQLKANSIVFAGDSAAVQGKNYTLKNKGYYKFLVLATLSNGKAVELMYTVNN